MQLNLHTVKLNYIVHIHTELLGTVRPLIPFHVSECSPVFFGSPPVSLLVGPRCAVVTSSGSNVWRHCPVSQWLCSERVFAPCKWSDAQVCMVRRRLSLLASAVRHLASRSLALCGCIDIKPRGNATFLERSQPSGCLVFWQASQRCELRCCWFYFALRRSAGDGSNARNDARPDGVPVTISFCCRLWPFDITMKHTTAICSLQLELITSYAYHKVAQCTGLGLSPFSFLTEQLLVFFFKSTSCDNFSATIYSRRLAQYLANSLCFKCCVVVMNLILNWTHMKLSFRHQAISFVRLNEMEWSLAAQTSCQKLA